ncbi:MFS transporter [Paucibacter sp. TC2R-5]|uniref:MFS transporter n=1 Tax=Paucibacter sp. TC2R-5 TaxID=2893555 RepID=UPI0021E47ED2|nr:MFS transporter [Paucibacter sp. TC2R-5]MCV2358521.1 MFS transporter [Paucibacter sp. TC2R-5]
MPYLTTRLQACTPCVRQLLLSELLGLLASAATQTGVAWWIAGQGGGADMAVYGAVTALCSLLAMPLLSPFGDRWPKQQLVRLARTGLLLDALALALLASSGLYSLALLCACSVLATLANALLLPAQASMLPELVATEQLPEAIRLRRTAQAIGSLLGPGLSGALLAFGGVAPAMTLNVLLFGLACLAAQRLKQAPYAAAPPGSRGWRSDISAGLRAKWGVTLDRWWSLTGALMMIFLLPAIGMLLPLRLQSMQLSALWFGACGAALSVGLLMGLAGLADALTDRLGRVRAIGVAVALCGLAVGSIGVCDSAPGLLALFALIGLSMSVTQLVGQTHRALAVPENFRARMAAGQMMIAQLAAALAPAIAGLLLLRWEVAEVYLWLSAGFLGSGLLLLAVPELRPFLRLDHEQVKNWYGRRYPEAFAARR